MKRRRMSVHLAYGRDGLDVELPVDRCDVDRCDIVRPHHRPALANPLRAKNSDGVPVWVNSEWVQATVRLSTGFVEPHFFAGSSGGPKMVTPGLAGLETVLQLHDGQRIGHPDATWGGLRGHPGT